MTTAEMIIDYKSYKWLVSSCLQKSIRRGRFDLAQHCVNFLWEHDRNYITYRLGTILTEDVGIANSDLIYEYLSTKLAKKQIDERGGLHFILDIVQKACLSVKDRSSCDVANLASYFNLDSSNIIPFDENNLYLHIQDKNVSYIDKINMVWSLLGNKRFKNDNLPLLDSYPLNEKNETIDNLSRFGKVGSLLKLKSTIIDVMLLSYQTQVENMCLGLPIIEVSYLNELEIDKEKITNTTEHKKTINVGDNVQNMYVKETSIFHPVLNFEIISAGVDGHTREGKSVYYKYLKTNNPFNQYLRTHGIDEQLDMLIFSHCMFRLEGHEVNNRLYFPTAVNVMRDCEQLILNMKCGNEPYKNTINFQEIKRILLSEMPKINNIREQFINNMQANMIDKPVPKVKKQKIKNNS